MKLELFEQLGRRRSGYYIGQAEPVLLSGDAGTGKSHLATGLCVAACRQRRRVRFTTATALVNELFEAAYTSVLNRALGRWERLDRLGDAKAELKSVPEGSPHARPGGKTGDPL